MFISVQSGRSKWLFGCTHQETTYAISVAAVRMEVVPVRTPTPGRRLLLPVAPVQIPFGARLDATSRNSIFGLSKCFIGVFSTLY
jgi:hypothetical protein